MTPTQQRFLISGLKKYIKKGWIKKSQDPGRNMKCDHYFESVTAIDHEVWQEETIVFAHVKLPTQIDHCSRCGQSLLAGFWLSLWLLLRGHRVNIFEALAQQYLLLHRRAVRAGKRVSTDHSNPALAAELQNYVNLKGIQR